MAGCEQLEKEADTAGGFFRPPPVLPVLEVIQTSVPTGFCATAAMSDQLGHAIPGAEVTHLNGLSLIQLNNHGKYPLSLLSFPCDEIFILRLGLDEDMCFVSSFFVSKGQRPGHQKIYHVGPFPVMLDDHQVRAILVRNQVFVRDELNLELNLTQGEIDYSLEKLRRPIPDDVSVAVEQNAWAIEIGHGDTWTDFSDDTFLITGGEQDISSLTNPDLNAASVMQMAMIGLLIDPSCHTNPLSGFSVLREIKVGTGPGSQLDDLVLGTIFYTFDGSCTGIVKVPLATGSFILSIGQEVEFNMMDN
jgi:hypothetical protein